MKNSQTTRISTKLPDSQQNIGEVWWKVLKLQESQQNYQILNKTPRKLPESQQNYQNLNKTTRISTNQGVMGDTPPTKLPEYQQNTSKSSQTTRISAKHLENYPNYQNINQSGGHWGHSPN